LIPILLGLWEDRVTACGTGSLNDIKNPGYANKFSYGNGYNVDPELVIESGVETIICYTQTDTTAPDMKALIASTGAKLNILCINHESLLRCVVTYGFLFDVTEISQKYTEYADKGTEIIQESMKNIPTEDQPSVAIVMLYGSASTDKIRVLGYNSDTTKNSHNLGKLMNSVPNANWVRADLESPSYGTYVTSEWFLENQPDYIIVAGSGIGTTSDMSFEEVYQVFFNKCKEVFGETEAFKNGNIVATSNGLTNGYSMHLISPKLLSMVYDEIDDDLSNEIYNSWYDDFTLYKVEDCPNEMIFYVNKS
jgi:ABC-type Fe3+-hydroxamate transport system substrate-binding protein